MRSYFLIALQVISVSMLIGMPVYLSAQKSSITVSTKDKELFTLYVNGNVINPEADHKVKVKKLTGKQEYRLKVVFQNSGQDPLFHNVYVKKGTDYGYRIKKSKKGFYEWSQLYANDGSQLNDVKASKSTSTHSGSGISYETESHNAHLFKDIANEEGMSDVPGVKSMETISTVGKQSEVSGLGVEHKSQSAKVYDSEGNLVSSHSRSEGSIDFGKTKSDVSGTVAAAKNVTGSDQEHAHEYNPGAGAQAQPNPQTAPAVQADNPPEAGAAPAENTPVAVTGTVTATNTPPSNVTPEAVAAPEKDLVPEPEPIDVKSKGFARVRKVEGIEIYMLCDPVRENEFLYTSTIKDNPMGFLKSLNSSAGLDEGLNDLIEKVKKDHPNSNPIEAIITQDCRTASVVTFTGKEHFGYARVSQVQAMDVYVMNKPTVAVDTLFQVQAGSTSSVGSINAYNMLSSMVDNAKEQAQSSNQQVDAVITSDGKNGFAVRYKGR